MNFMLSSPSCSARRLCADNAAKRTLELDAKELELARRYSESLCEAHDPATVEQRQDSVFSIQQRIHQIVDPLHVASERLSQRHGSRVPVRRYSGAKRTRSQENQFGRPRAQQCRGFPPERSRIDMRALVVTGVSSWIGAKTSLVRHHRVMPRLKARSQ
jgi:hypothetical protein